MSLGTIPSIIGITGTGILVPMIYLLFRATGDPEGVIDGLVRFCWPMPLVWLGGALMEARGRLRALKGVLKLHAPLVVGLCLISFFMLGLRNDGAEIVFNPSREARTETARRAREGEPVLQSRLPLVGALGHWAHNHLPPHPLPIGRDR